MNVRKKVGRVRGGNNLARDMDRWRDTVNMVINHQDPQNSGNSPDKQWQLLRTNCYIRFVVYGLQQSTHSGESISVNDRQNATLHDVASVSSASVHFITKSTSWSFSLRSLIQYPIISFFLDPNIHVYIHTWTWSATYATHVSCYPNHTLRHQDQRFFSWLL